MNDNPYGQGGGCGPVLLWLIIVGIVIAGFIAVTGAFDTKYHCYTNPVGPERAEDVITGLSYDEASELSWRYDCYETH